MDPIRTWNKHAREFGALHRLRLRLAEDGEIRVLLGPRKTENHASLFGFVKGTWLWGVYFVAPQPSRVTDPIKGKVLGVHPLDGEGWFLVKEKDLLKVCSLNRWTKPRYRKVVAQRARELDQFKAAVQSLDSK